MLRLTLCRTISLGSRTSARQYGHRFHSMEPAQRSSDDCTDVRVRVAQVTDQGGDDRGTDRFQDERQPVPLLLRQRSAPGAATPAVGRSREHRKLGNAFRARSWIGSWGLQKSVIVSASSFPCRRDAKI